MNLKWRTPQEARDVLDELRPLTDQEFVFKGRTLSMYAAMLQTRERRTRNRMLLQTAEALRAALKDTAELQRVKAKRPYDLVCWRSPSVVVCGRVSFDPDKVLMTFQPDWWGPALSGSPREEIEETVGRIA